MSSACWLEAFTLAQPGSIYVSKFINNTCILDVTVNTNHYNSTNPFQLGDMFDNLCNSVDWDTKDSSIKSTLVGIQFENNEYYIQDATSTNVGICQQNMKKLQGNYMMDLNSAVYGTWPSDDQIIQNAKSLIFS